MEPVTAARASEPSSWFFAFSRTSAWPWLNRAPLRFKHVSAFGYMPGFDAWLFYDVHWFGTSLFLASHEETKRRVGEMADMGPMVLFPVRRRAMSLAPRILGFYCVPAMAHLAGLPCVAVTPNGFYREIMRNGGTIVNASESAATAARPDAPIARETSAN